MMADRYGTEPVRWGILGTAGIAASGFLPALREAGGGDAIAVAGYEVKDFKIDRRNLPLAP